MTPGVESDGPILQPSEGLLGRGPRSRRWRMAAVFLLMAAVGALLVPDFGMSWDEHRNANVGQNALAALWSEHAYQAYLEHGESLGHHGPGFFMLQALLAGVLARLAPFWHLADARHFVTYITYLLALFAFYSLSIRLIPRKYGLMATSLLALQPLVFGHAFINQKDTPFMAFFLATVAFGMLAGDRLLRTGVPADASDRAGASASGQSPLRLDWESMGRGARLVFAGYAVLLTLVLADILFFGRGLAFARAVVSQMYTGQAWPPVQTLFDFVAQDAHKTPLEAYWFKITWAYLIGRVFVVIALAALGIVLGLRCFPRSFRAPAAANRQAFPILLVAAACLGMTIAIRPVGAFAGGLVALDWTFRLRRRMPVFLILYLALAAAVCYLSWPWLWQSPLQNLLHSLSLNLDFEDHLVLFRGIHFLSEELPWEYFPTLAALQLTEPVMPLFLLGLVGAVRLLMRRGDGVLTLALALLWLGVPVGVILSGRTTPYGTIRQMLFVLPPIFLICGIGLHWLLSWLSRWRLDLVAYGLILVPGLLGIIQLHPYEYTYFNSLVGGTSGAAGQFETDYWCTSYREAMGYVNAEADPDAVVAVFGPVEAAADFARDDLKVRTEERARGREVYWLVCDGMLETAKALRPDWERRLVIGEGKAEFTIVLGKPEAQ